MLWGTVGVTTQLLYNTSRANPLSIGFFRLGIATPVLALACWVLLGRRVFRIARRDLARMALIGVMLALYQACFFAAIIWVGVAVATLVTLCHAPVLVARLAASVLGERLTRPGARAVLAALGGVVCVAGGQPGARGGADLRGIALACGSAFGYAIVTLAGRSLAGRYHATQINLVAFAVGALTLLPVALVTGFVVSYPARGWALLVYLGLVPTALAYGLFITGMRATPALVASILTLLEPLTATFLAWLIFGERLRPLGWVGAALLLGAIAALALAQRGMTRSSSAVPAVRSIEW